MVGKLAHCLISEDPGLYQIEMQLTVLCLAAIRLVKLQTI